LTDWDQGTGSGGGPGPFGNDAYNDFSNSGVLNQVTNTDLTLMHVLGWEANEPQNFIINGEMYFIDNGQQSVNDLVIEPGGSLEIAAGGTLNGTVTFDGPGGFFEIDGPNAPTNTIKGFVAGDTIDFYGAAVGAHPGVKLLAGNILQIVENGQTYHLQFDPNEDFSGQNFHISDDGYGGTLIFLDPTVASLPSSGGASLTVTGPGITNGSGDLNAGHVVTFTLNMNEAINIDTTNGTPTFSLNDGGSAIYTSGSGTNALTFTYTVANGENTPDLAITAFNLNGGTAQDANGHDAVFTSAIGNPPGILQIDTTPPHVTSVSAPPVLGAVTLVLSFDEPVQTVGTPGLVLAGEFPGTFDGAATASLHDPTKLAFDFDIFGRFTAGGMATLPGTVLSGVFDHAGNAAVMQTGQPGTSPIAIIPGDIVHPQGASGGPSFDFHLFT
jgi:hypothetical protein